MKNTGRTPVAEEGLRDLLSRALPRTLAMILAFGLMAGTGHAADFNVTVFDGTMNTSATDDPDIANGAQDQAGQYRDQVLSANADATLDRILWTGVNGGTLDLTSNVSLSGPLNINVNTMNGAGLNVTSSLIGHAGAGVGTQATYAMLTGSANVTISGDEVLTLQDATLNNGANTLRIAETAGLTLQNPDNATLEHLNNSVALEIDSMATFTMTNDTETIGSLSGSGGAFLNNSTLMVGSTNTSTTYSGAFFVDATSNVTKTGTAKMTLTGNNDGTGFLHVAGGSVQLDAVAGVANSGTWTGSVNVDNGASFYGFGGTINGSLNSSGVVSPGDATQAGTLNIGGNYNQTNAGRLLINVDSTGAADQVNLTGSGSVANLEGALNLDVAQAASTVDLFALRLSPVSTPNNAAGRNGTFDTVGIDSDIITPVLSYTTQGVSVTFAINNTGLANAATTDNELAVGQAFTQAFGKAGIGTDSRQTFNTFAALRGSNVTLALKEMAGESRASALSGNIQAGIATSGRVMAQLGSIRSGVHGVRTPGLGGGNDQYSSAGSAAGPFGQQFAQNQNMGTPGMPTFGSALGLNGLMANAINGTHAGGRWAGDEQDQVWLLGLGYWGDLESTATRIGSQYTGGGFMAGRTWTLNDNWLAGVHGGYNATDVTVPFSRDNSEMKTFNVGGHASYAGETFYTDMMLNIAFDNYDTRRFLTQFNGSTATADFDGTQVSFYTEAGWVLRIGENEYEDSIDGWFWQPQAAFQYRSVNTDAYTEAGAGALNLAVAENDLNMFQTALGFKIFNVTELEAGGWLVPDLQLRWGHEFGDVERQVSSSFTGTTPTFVVAGREQERDSLQVRAGLAGYDVLTMDFDVSYNGSFASGQQDHAAVARFIRRF